MMGATSDVRRSLASCSSSVSMPEYSSAEPRVEAEEGKNEASVEGDDEEEEEEKKVGVQDEERQESPKGKVLVE